MTCPYAELANKLDVHQKMAASPGFRLSALDVQTIIEALRYTADWKAAIGAADSDNQQQRNIE